MPYSEKAKGRVASLVAQSHSINLQKRGEGAARNRGGEGKTIHTRALMELLTLVLSPGGAGERERGGLNIFKSGGISRVFAKKAFLRKIIWEEPRLKTSAEGDFGWDVGSRRDAINSGVI